MATTARFDELHALNAPDANDEPFARTDEVTVRFVRLLVRRFGRLRARVAADDARDVLILMQAVRDAYEDAWGLYERCLEESYAAKFREMLPRAREPDARAAFLAFSRSYATPEGYVPENEWERKRARCLESIVAAIQGSPTRGGARRSATSAVDTARNACATQVRQGADDMTARAMRDAYREAGVERVRYVTQRDDRVCGECAPLDGRTYRVGDEPQIPLHYRCRCFYVPA